MAKAVFVQDGKSIDYTPSAAVFAGDVVVIGELVGVAPNAIAASSLGAVALSGVWKVVKDANAITAGAKVYWNAPDAKATASADNGLTSTAKVDYSLMGKAVSAAAAGDGVVLVKLG